MTTGRTFLFVAFVALPIYVSAEQSNPAAAPCNVGDRFFAKGLQGEVRSVWADEVRVQPDGAEAYDQVRVPLPFGTGRYIWPAPSAPAYGTAKPTPRPTAEAALPDPDAKCVPKTAAAKVEDSGQSPTSSKIVDRSRVLGAGIVLLTADLLKAALTATETELATASSPELAKLAAATAYGIYSYLPKDPPFSVTISTPWTRAAIAALEAKRKYEPAPSLSIDALNRLGLSINVSPGSSLTTADAIENVVIKRGEIIIRPIDRSVKPHTIQNAMGAKRELSSGSFTFEMDALQPTTDLTIVLIGKRGNYEITLIPAELSYLR
jgi:hypothetical protein